jgi:hypothetical protein
MKPKVATKEDVMEWLEKTIDVARRRANGTVEVGMFDLEELKRYVEVKGK